MLWIVENTLLAALLALIVALVSRTARLAPVIRHGLWLVVLLKLITPPIFSVALPIPAAWREFARVERTGDSTDADEHNGQGNRADRDTGLASQDRLPSPAESSVPPSPPAGEGSRVSGPAPASNDDPAPSASHIDNAATDHYSTTTADPPTVMADAELPGRIAQTLIAADNSDTSSINRGDTLSPVVRLGQTAVQIGGWFLLAGTCVCVLLQASRLIRLWRLLQRTVPASGELTALAAELADRMRFRPPAVRVSREIRSPIVCALGKAVLIWPASGLDSLRGAARRAIIVHELAHLARRDHWIGWLELVAGCAWWWNPLFWYVRHQLHENAELACDAWAAGLFPAGKGDYARALVALAEQESFPMAAVPALGVGRGSRKLFERRLVMILGDRVRYQLGTVGLVGIGLLGLVALVGCSASLAGDETAPVAVIAVDEPAVVVDTIEAKPVPAAGEPAAEFVVQPGAGERFTVEVAFPPTEAAPPSNEDRLKRLEDKFDALLSELRELKSGPSPTRAKGVKEAPAGITWSKKPAPAAVAEHKAVPADKANPGAVQNYVYHPDHVERVAKGKRPPDQQEGEPVTVALIRATYPGFADHKAKQIADFLGGNVTGDVLVRYDATNHVLQVTASEEDQAVVAQFLRLLHPRGTATPRRTSTRLDAFPGATPAGPNGFPGAAPRTGPVPVTNSDSVKFTSPVDPARNEKSATPPPSDNLPAPGRAPGARPAELPGPEKSVTRPSSENTLEPIPVPEKQRQ
ncbi:MAG: hypothetical protein HY290_15425 [Planctomycetia bacterium]|nr:hypothetical protein [Planctomycetia bacterium]